MARPLRLVQPLLANGLEELARNVGSLRREVRTLDSSLLETRLDNATGWASYVHTGAAQTLAANTKVTLANDAGSIIQPQKPTDIASFYSGGLITGRNGDSIVLGVNLTFTPSSALASKLYLAIDLGGSIGEIEPVEYMVINGSDIPHRISYTKAPYMGATFAANGGAVKIMTDGPGTCTAMIFTMHRLHSA